MSSYLPTISTCVQTVMFITSNVISRPENVAFLITSIAAKYIFNSNKFSCLLGGAASLAVYIYKIQRSNSLFNYQVSQAQLLKTFLFNDKSLQNFDKQSLLKLCQYFTIDFQVLINIYDQHPLSPKERISLFYETLPKDKKPIFE